ncbi:MAG: acyl-CoA synthetase [Gammaproteobacteria bacterium RIFCSPHIGHO2_02_FULL_39_13]|nr:MAG: acyl-CoA synthetase [Gammaproteobacteria bacterium RIFCSPHIGHO2_02_FULL_39_13]OGT49630.1 MAG: acyl-CoA synthetase [Gammaproteobacteria bacterium RIFCSPHIGHO2_12_FULL_39_24]
MASTASIHTAHTFSPTLESIEIDFSALTVLTDVLRHYAVKEPNRPHIYLQDDQGNEQTIRYGELYSGAQAVAKGLVERGIKFGETIAIMLPSTDEFFYAYAGILLAGAVPVPIYPPTRADQIEEYAKREVTVLQNAQARMLITFARVKMLSDMLRAFVPSLKEVATLDHVRSETGVLPDIIINPNDIALIQYTSGSTGDPKGVVLTHENMLANLRGINSAIQIKPTDVNVSWLPLYHDMGLMNWLASLYFGVPLTVLSPLIFLSRPEKWLWAIHYHRASISGAPNFAYEMCVKTIETKDIQGLDLSCWRVAFCGAETINPKTIQKFIQKFSQFGLKAEAVTPAYGLAESTVALTVSSLSKPPRVDKIERTVFEKENRAVVSHSEDEKQYVEFVSCGTAIPQHPVRIVDDHDQLLPERRVGNIQFSGPSSTQGYYNNAAATQQMVHAHFLETGDLGYIADHELFVTGRKKDLIIKAGRNIYPEEIEEIVNEVPGVFHGGVIAFGLPDPKTGTEKIVVVVETSQTNKTEQEKIRSEIINQLSVKLGMPSDMIIFISPNTIPKTPSHKLQRSLCKKMVISGKISQHRIPAKFQLIKLFLKTGIQKMKHALLTSLKFIYAVYVGLILLITVPVMWVMLLLLSQPNASTVCRIWARQLFRLVFCPVTVRGKQNLHHHRSMIYVANHASYVDALLLLAILPSKIMMIGKKELLERPFLRMIITKIGFIAVDRMDISKSVEDSKLITAEIKKGQSILLFPEGTFTYATGLRPFKLGAFQLSADAQTPICPIAINGARILLRDGTCLPMPTKITITVGEPIFPEKNDWNEVARLHALVRAEIAKHCGEPAIDVITANLN